MQDASGSDEFAFAARGEWFCQDGVAVMVVQDHEVLATMEELTGKCPVRSVLTFPVNSTVCRYAIWVQTPVSYGGMGGVVITGGLEMGVVEEVVLVERNFCQYWRR